MDNPHDNPLARAQRGHRAPPCAMVIFGASGDLTKRLLMPALYNLARARRLSEHFAVVGVDRSEWSEDAFRAHLAEGVRSFVSDTGGAGPAGEAFDPDTWDFIAARMSHIDGDATSAEIYGRLGKRLKEIEKEYGTGGNVIFYLAVAPALFGPVVERLAEAGLTAEKDGYWRRVIIEKPFGTDLASAQTLDERLLKALSEGNI